MANGARFHRTERDMTRGTWIKRGACVEHPNPEWWFHATATPLKTPETFYTKAAEVCADCPVRVECGDYAIATSQPHGMWGGLTPKQRDRIRTKAQYVDPKARTIHHRRTCMSCARKRRIKFFPDDELSVCVDCLEGPIPDPAPPNPGADSLRRVPPDDVLRDVLMDDSVDVAGLAAEWGVSYETVTKHRLRIRRKFGLPDLVGGRSNRRVPSDAEMRELFKLRVRDATLADEWGVSRRTVHRHKKRLGFA